MSTEVEAVVIDDKGIEVQYAPATISDNLDKVEAFVDSQLAIFEGAEIDLTNNDHVKEARKVMADLNKLKKPIEDERKRIKREYEAPLKAFEARVKQITSKIDEARADIKKQVDEADELWKNERFYALEEDYRGIAGDFAQLVPFEAIVEDKWLNRSTSTGKATAELEDKTARALEGYNTLKTKDLEYHEQVIQKYLHTLDIVSALQVEDELKEQARILEEQRKQREAIEAERVKRIEEMQAKAKEQEPEPAVSEPVKVEQVASDPVVKWTLTIEATRQQALWLADILKSNGIHGSFKAE